MNLMKGPRRSYICLMAGEKVKAEYASPCPDVSESERGSEFQVISLPALVEMKLNSYRRKDQTHLLDMIEVGLDRCDLAYAVSCRAGRSIARVAR